MSISLLLEMAASSDPDRTAVVSGDMRLTTDELSALADGGAGVIAASGAQHVAYVGTGGAMLPLLLFSSARAAVAVTPLNYRLSGDGLRELIDRLPNPLVVADAEYRDVVAGAGKQVIASDEFIASARTAEPAAEFADPDDIAVVLFTSGTTSRPKAVELTHNNLTSYVTGTVEFGSRRPDDAALICVPPYHIAGCERGAVEPVRGPKDGVPAPVRRRRVGPAGARRRRHDRDGRARPCSTASSPLWKHEPTELPTLRNLAYGGSKVALPLVRKALGCCPSVGFVNAYGLTETSSTIAVLTPDDHRDALGASTRTRSPAARLGRPTGPGHRGADPRRRRHRARARARPASCSCAAIRCRAGTPRSVRCSTPRAGSPPKTSPCLTTSGYLFIGGRSDDTIIRGGENIAPAEIEDVLVEHPDVRDCAVVGAEDPEWGQIIVAVVVPADRCRPDPDELREHVAHEPARIAYARPGGVPRRAAHHATGKVLRRELVAS